MDLSWEMEFHLCCNLNWLSWENPWKVTNDRDLGLYTACARLGVPSGCQWMKEGETFMVLTWSGDTLWFCFHLERVTSHVEIIPGVSACKLHLFFVNARSVGKRMDVWGYVKSLVKCGKRLGFRVNPKSLFCHFQPMWCQVSFLNSLNLFSTICKCIFRCSHHEVS